MIYLVLSILANTAIYLLFKWYGNLRVRILDAIVFNYLTAATIGILVITDWSTTFGTALQAPPWVIAATMLGAVFISVFYLMSLTTQKVGVSVATIASKMSLVIAALIFVWLGKEQMNGLGYMALLFAFLSVFLVSYRNVGKVTLVKMLFWPLLILVGSTAIDFVIAYFADQPSNADERALYSCLSFITAGTIGILLLTARYFVKGILPSRRDILAGVLLGTVNYGSIYFLVESYHANLLSTAQTLQVNNLAVVVLGAFAARLIFKESWSKVNLLGIALGIIALSILICSH